MRLLVVAAFALGAACSEKPQASPQAAQPTAVPPVTIESGRILDRIKVLSSDDYEGRAPGTKGEDLTVRYLEDEFKKLGLKPGNSDGTYVQRVPLVGITATNSQPLVVAKGTQKQTFKWADDVVAWTKHVADGASIQSSELVFVGYGVEAPEYSWNDFKDVDVKGKTIVVLVNDPQVPDPSDATKLDARTFNGTAMTYYGRWTYKFEEGARKGAAGVLIVHETGPAGYPFSVVQGQPAREVRPGDARQEHGPCGDRRLDHARRGEEDPRDGRPGLRRAQEAGPQPRLPSGSPQPDGIARRAQHHADARLAQRRRQSSRGRIRR